MLVNAGLSEVQLQGARQCVDRGRPWGPGDLAQFVQREIASGKYQSEAEVICQRLRMLRERERRLEALRRDVQAGLDQLDRGERAPLEEGKRG